MTTTEKLAELPPLDDYLPKSGRWTTALVIKAMHAYARAALAATPAAEPVPGAVMTLDLGVALVGKGQEDAFIARNGGKRLYTAPVAATPAAPQGWKLVPLEPTPEMTGAMQDAALATGDWGWTRAVYAAMLAAAPVATTPAAAQGTSEQDSFDAWAAVSLDGKDLGEADLALLARHAHLHGWTGAALAATSAASNMPAASLTPEWLWSKLMDWCRQRGMNPAEHNALFRIVSESRKLAAPPAAPQAEREAFYAWANAAGYDVAHTFDPERSGYVVWLSPMTADLWKCWQARTALAATPAAPLTADDMREPKNGESWRVEWWNESARLMLPAGSKLDTFQAYKNGTLMFTIKRAGKGKESSK